MTARLARLPMAATRRAYSGVAPKLSTATGPSAELSSGSSTTCARVRSSAARSVQMELPGCADVIAR
jgi:hypothetical protein